MAGIFSGLKMIVGGKSFGRSISTSHFSNDPGYLTAEVISQVNTVPLCLIPDFRHRT
jgi:hypothetical protein